LPRLTDCLTQCPLHPRGGCGFASHGTYARKTPAGTRIARWYCREGHCTFSLLPDHLAARLPGTLAEIEQAALAAESAPSLEVCADALRPEPIGLPGALRWLRRRIDYVRAVLPTVVALLPQQLQGCAPTIAGVRRHLGVDQALQRLRPMLAAHLGALAAPLGLHPRAVRGERRAGGFQQPMGPDPPALAA
jgi:hypothetical protein